MSAEYPIQDVIRNRWSPYSFAERSIPEDDLRSLFEAARWGASSYNEQPWRFIVATRDNPEEFARAVSCLAEANQEWAKTTSAIVIAVVSRTFERNGNENRHARHDLGLAMGNLLLEATSRGIVAHQMAGIDATQIREIYEVPQEFDIVSATALGYTDEAAPAGRSRRPLGQQVFSGRFGEPSPLF